MTLIDTKYLDNEYVVYATAKRIFKAEHPTFEFDVEADPWAIVKAQKMIEMVKGGIQDAYLVEALF